MSDVQQLLRRKYLVLLERKEGEDFVHGYMQSMLIYATSCRLDDIVYLEEQIDKLEQKENYVPDNRIG